MKLNERNIKLFNLDISKSLNYTNDNWQMPIIKKCDYIPSDLIGFNEIYKAKRSNRYNCGIHFYLYDYFFERLWGNPDLYLEKLRPFDCVLSPDFSCYTDMPQPQQIYNIYRSRFIGAYYQAKGLTVIPTISWSNHKSFEYCFKGIEKGSVVSISTVGVYRDNYGRLLFERGIKECIKQIEPKTFIIYGNEVNIDFEGVKTIYIKNKNVVWRREND